MSSELKLKKTILIKFSLVIIFQFLLIQTSSQAEVLQCESIFNSNIQGLQSTQILNAEKNDLNLKLEKNYSERNQILSKRYPGLSFVFNDPELFVNTMRDRFEKQKQITPEDPRLFSAPEYSENIIGIRNDLEIFRQEVATQLKFSKAKLKNIVSLKLTKVSSHEVQTLTKVLMYIHQLQSDLDLMISEKQYPYKDVIYATYFYSRIRGFFQFKELNSYYQIAKYIDMVMHGYRRLTIDQELSLYKNDGNPIVQVRSGKIANDFRTAELPFLDAFERKDVLEYVVVPSIQALGASAFMHVLPYQIHFFGATNSPVQADGFNRPGGLFWMHDVRHEADRYMKWNSYKKAQSLSLKQEKQFRLQMQEWQTEFLEFKNKITDPDLKASVEHYHFYMHHDIGIPMIPSMFLNHHLDGITVYYAFLFHKKWSGQTPAFKNWFDITQKTQELLTQFWLDRKNIEFDILQKEPTLITNWADWFPQSHPYIQTQQAVLQGSIELKLPLRLKFSAVGVEGILSKVYYNAIGEPVYFQMSGPVRLIDLADQTISNQGFENHQSGYSSPIGVISELTINGESAKITDLTLGQVVKIKYQSGIVVEGTVNSLQTDIIGQPIILTFQKAEVKMGNQILYKPQWGKFDLIIGDTIKEVQKNI